MSLTKEEKEYLSLIDYLDSSYYEMTESAHITKHRDIIDRLVKENEELRRLGELTQELLIEKKVINPQPISGVELYMHLEGYIKHLQSQLSTIVEAAGPFLLSLKKMESKSNGVSEPDEMPISGFGRSIRDVPIMGDLRKLSEAVEEVDK